MDDVPLPEGDALLNTSAVLTLGMGAACVVAPRKIHEMYFADDDMDDDRVPVSAYKYYKKERSIHLVNTLQPEEAELGRGW